MLIRFKISNFLSFDEEQTFSMINGATENHPSHIVRLPDIGVLRLSAMYGANASGKSNFIKALEVMKNLVVYNEPIIADRFFKPKPENIDKPSLFEVEISLKGRLFSYGFEYIISKQEVIDEWLHEIFTDKDSNIIFERTGGEIRHNFENSDKERMDIYAEDAIGHSQRLFLNIVGDFVRSKDVALKVFSDVKKWFDNKLIILDTNLPFLPNRTLDEAYFIKLNTLMASFGTGINEIGYELKIGMERNLPPSLVDNLKKTMMAGKDGLNSMEHTSTKQYESFKDYRISLSDDNSLIFEEILFRHNDGKVTFHHREESDGTKKLFVLAANLYVKDDDITYLVDDLDLGLHPNIAYRFVKIFLENDLTSGKQLIFTTHESSLMHFDLVRRDEIWFIEKDSNGSSHIYSLEEFNERNDRRIEKAYREGRYGGIPMFSSPVGHSIDEEDN